MVSVAAQEGLAGRKSEGRAGRGALVMPASALVRPGQAGKAGLESSHLIERALAALKELTLGLERDSSAILREMVFDSDEIKIDHLRAWLILTIVRLHWRLMMEGRAVLDSLPNFGNRLVAESESTSRRDVVGEQIGDRELSLSKLFIALRNKFRNARECLQGELEFAQSGLCCEGGGTGNERSAWTELQEILASASFSTPENHGDSVFDRVACSSSLLRDETVFKILESLVAVEAGANVAHALVKFGNLEVTCIGSIYEAMVGLELKRAVGVSLILRPSYLAVDLELLVKKKRRERVEYLAREAGCELNQKEKNGLFRAKSIEDLIKALRRKLPASDSENRSDYLIQKGKLYWQPGQGRRQSGSHYTPREMADSVVGRTLKPLLESQEPYSEIEKILSLKVCDPAMGSGTFLIAVCRYLGDRLITALNRINHAELSTSEEREARLHAERMVAEQCVYGVDIDWIAVETAKLSLCYELKSLPSEMHFLESKLKCGDSLVGFGRRTIRLLYCAEKDYCLAELGFGVRSPAAEPVEGLAAPRSLEDQKRTGDAIIEAFFTGKYDQAKRIGFILARIALQENSGSKAQHSGKLNRNLCRGIQRKEGSKNRADGKHWRENAPFHWELEFPDVFQDQDGSAMGFDAIVGNPPFLGGTRISTVFGGRYLEFLKIITPESGNRMDLAAYFLRRCFGLLRDSGTMGLITTNTVYQGDTRRGGLEWIRQNGGTIYSAERRVEWRGPAAVVASVVHVKKGDVNPPYLLDGRPVEKITSFLLPINIESQPRPLSSNRGIAFEGYKVYGQGFLFADKDAKASPLSEMERLISSDPRNKERIKPYLGGDELNNSFEHRHHRYVIDFSGLPEEKARLWPELIAILQKRARPERLAGPNQVSQAPWWQFFCTRPELRAALEKVNRVLACSKVSTHLAFAWLPTNIIFSHKLAVFACDHDALFAILQSQVHESFARMFSSTLGDALNYSPSDCFESFPFPKLWRENPVLAQKGREVYCARAEAMKKLGNGMTQLYNRINNPHEEEPLIIGLRQMHCDLDLAVMRAYGWKDLPNDRCFRSRSSENRPLESDDGCMANATSISRVEAWAMNSSHASKSQRMRYLWPKEIENEIIARLVALNKAEKERDQ